LVRKKGQDILRSQQRKASLPEGASPGGGRGLIVFKTRLCPTRKKQARWFLKKKEKIPTGGVPPSGKKSDALFGNEKTLGYLGKKKAVRGRRAGTTRRKKKRVDLPPAITEKGEGRAAVQLKKRRRLSKKEKDSG